MAKECCVCGEKITIMDSYELSPKYSKYKVCDVCALKIRSINYCGQVKKVQEALAYFAPYLQKSDIDPMVRNAVNDLLEEAYKFAQEREENGSYEQKYNQLLRELNETKTEHNYEILAKNLKVFVENSLITSGYDFVGYDLIAYHGVVSGEVVLGTGFLSELSASFSDFFGVSSNEFAEKLKSAKNAAKIKLMEEAIKVGGNAIIGVDFDYVVFGNNVIGVCANGTAVEVKKKETIS